eukprot:g6680.t1
MPPKRVAPAGTRVQGGADATRQEIVGKSYDDLKREDQVRKERMLQLKAAAEDYTLIADLATTALKTIENKDATKVFDVQLRDARAIMSTLAETSRTEIDSTIEEVIAKDIETPMSYRAQRSCARQLKTFKGEVKIHYDAYKKVSDVEEVLQEEVAKVHTVNEGKIKTKKQLAILDGIDDATGMESDDEDKKLSGLEKIQKLHQLQSFKHMKDQMRMGAGMGMPALMNGGMEMGMPALMSGGMGMGGMGMGGMAMGMHHGMGMGGMGMGMGGMKNNGAQLAIGDAGEDFRRQTALARAHYVGGAPAPSSSSTTKNVNANFPSMVENESRTRLKQDVPGKYTQALLNGHPCPANHPATKQLHQHLGLVAPEKNEAQQVQHQKGRKNGKAPAQVDIEVRMKTPDRVKYDLQDDEPSLSSNFCDGISMGLGQRAQIMTNSEKKSYTYAKIYGGRPDLYETNFTPEPWKDPALQNPKYNKNNKRPASPQHKSQMPASQDLASGIVPNPTARKRAGKNTTNNQLGGNSAVLMDAEVEHQESMKKMGRGPAKKAEGKSKETGKTDKKKDVKKDNEKPKATAMKTRAPKMQKK